MKFAFVVVVNTDTAQHADQVMSERLDPEEQYEDATGVRFDYTIDPPIPAPLDVEVPYFRRFGQ